MKYIVQVAWNREAAEIAEEKGMYHLQKLYRKLKDKSSLDFTEVEFETEAEAKAYIRGIEDGNGWDSPFTEITLNN